MGQSVRPVIFCSRCLGFAPCRWNGVVIPDLFVEKLKDFCDIKNVCPEVEAGLGVPRDPIRIVEQGGTYYLKQLNTQRDITGDMTSFAETYLADLGDMDGFILKDRSPSCGIKDVKVYPSLGKSAVTGKRSGFFASKVLEKYPHIPIESEGRLKNYNIREHFLTRLFVAATFRAVKGSARMKDLVGFHTRNKLLLMAYSQKGLSLLGNITANREGLPVEEVIKEYEQHLSNSLGSPPKYTSNINVMMHALGYFSKELSSEEKKFFLNTLEEYRGGQIPLSVPVGVLRSYIVRFGQEYLREQTFFRPYPEELVTVRDSGKGRSGR
jgi:uncharacterized protein YbgA (DUF1722 family)/uncharacterized protein YbbK (DUF523 family)